MKISCEMWTIVVENSCCFSQLMFSNSVPMWKAPWNLEKHKGKNMKQETQVFNCEKCKNEFPSIGSLKKHLRRIHEEKDLTLEENS